MLDTIQIVLWSITYILIIIAGLQSRDMKKVSMPYTAGIMNFGWEACALQQSQGFWGHILWFGLDMVIVYYGFCFLPSLTQRIIYVVSLYISIFALSYVFSLANGMLISVFVIDFIMAVFFLLERKKLSPNMKLLIAITKLLGDASAGLYYASASKIVCILAIGVCICNAVYLYLCILEVIKKMKVQNGEMPLEGKLLEMLLFFKSKA